ncbi:MAG: prolipoprotein diacylglyceryl transferase [Flavobacteriales bacterium]|nr:prolipoprotein diacylglyceryl transferase [Flavobacteriales bacterium]
MKTLFSIGSIHIQLFGVMIAVGIVVGFYILSLEVKRKALDDNKITDLAIYTVLIGILGARINYIIAFNPSYYIANPLEIIMLQKGGLSIQGGLIAGILFALWYVKKKAIPLGKTADAFAPAVIIGQAIGRVGCDVFGVAMSKPWFWGVQVEGQLLHPAQIYEAVLNYILFFVLWQKRKSIKYNGELFIYYLVGFSINRFLVEFARSNPIIFGPITIAHVYSLVLIAGAFILGLWFKSRGDSDRELLSNEINITTFEKKSFLIILTATIISIIFYYFIHSI